MGQKLATPIPLSRKRAALRLLRAREAFGISQEQLAEKLGCSKRQYGAIERARVRDIGLEALDLLLSSEPVVAPRSASIRLCRLPVSKHTVRSTASARHLDRNEETRRADAEHLGKGGVGKTSPSIPEGAGSAKEATKLDERSLHDIGMAALKLVDTRGAHAAQPCGAMATGRQCLGGAPTPCVVTFRRAA